MTLALAVRCARGGVVAQRSSRALLKREDAGSNPADLAALEA